jgi:hypothetical protein
MNWVFEAAGGVVSLGGLLLILAALFRDRPRGRRRCPKCWYNLSGTPGTLKCSECGHEAKREKRLLRTRRRWWRAAAGLLLLGAGGVTIVGAATTFDGILGVVPMGVWIHVLPLFDKQAEEAHAKVLSGANGTSVYWSAGWTPPRRVPRLQRLLVAEHIATFIRRGDVKGGTSALWAASRQAFQLESESVLVEWAAREQLDSSDVSIRLADIELLQTLRTISERTFSALDDRLLVEENPTVIAAAVRFFENRKRSPSGGSLLHASLLVDRSEFWTICRVATYRQGEDALGQLCNSDNRALVFEAADLVPNVGAACAAGTPGLLRLLGSEDDIGRARAGRALESIGPEARAALSALKNALKTDGNGAVRTNACEALASIARDEPELVVEALGDALSDAHRAVRVAAAKGLWQLGKGAAPAETHIRASLNDIDDEVVRWARRALKTLEDH